MAPVLGYWNIRGLAQPVRLLLSHTDTEFTDKRYDYGPPPDFDRSSWTNEKFSLGLEFPNLPYYMDGDTKLTQSVAIMRYLARKNKLDGSTDDEKSRVDLAEQQIIDLRSGLVRLSYNPDFNKLKDEYVKSLPDQLKLFSNFLGKHHWLAGDNITYVDFMFYEVLDQLQLLSSDCLSDYQNLKDYLSRFEALPAIEKYMKSEKFLKWPLNGDMAKFGSRHTQQP